MSSLCEKIAWKTLDSPIQPDEAAAASPRLRSAMSQGAFGGREHPEAI